jgi:diguanylate cyclase (GGDEF)-like protein
MIWLFVSYKWWHLIMNIINAGTISVIRLFSLNNAFEFGELTINEYLLSINAYIYLLFTVLLSFILYYIMNRELKLSNDKAEQFRMRSKMYEELVNIVKEESIDTTKIKQEFEGYFDPMTGCLTRLAYENLFVANTKKRLTERSIEITYIDLNELKQVNDNYGHTKGDAYLVAAVKAIKENISSYEGLFRIGGDEFVLITINQPIELLKNKLEAANKRLSQLVNIKGFSGQFSFGIATSSEVKDKDIRKIEQIADKRMYSMKNKKILITVAESASQQ